MTIRSLKTFLKKLHRNERGDIPVGPILIIGLIAIPLVSALVIFRDDLLGYLSERWGDFKGEETDAEFKK